MVDTTDRARRVCMFVYNNMLHDARVRREARTLTQAGYEVTVLCVHEPGKTLRRESVDGFGIVRLSRSVLGMSLKELSAWLHGRPLPLGTVSLPRSGATAAPRPRSRRARLLAKLDDVVRLTVYPLRRMLVFVRFVRAALRTRADVYHSHDLNTLLMGFVASRVGRARLVYDSHEIETGRARVTMPWWAHFLEGALIRRADRVICTNQTRGEITQRLYPIPPPAILRNLPAYVEPEPSSLLHDSLGLPQDAKIVLYQGGVQPDRGLTELLEAAPEIEGGLVVLLGSGKLKPALQARARQMGMDGKVFFHEAVPVGELPRWTACGYIGLQILQNTCLNHYSSLSNKLLEYIMAGVPAIASDLPEMRRVIEETGAGLIINASDPHVIAEAANTLLADEALRREMSEKAKAARGRYCWEVEEHVLTELYRELLAEDVNVKAESSK